MTMMEKKAQAIEEAGAVWAEGHTNQKQNQNGKKHIDKHSMFIMALGSHFIHTYRSIEVRTSYTLHSRT